MVVALVSCIYGAKGCCREIKLAVILCIRPAAKGLVTEALRAWSAVCDGHVDALSSAAVSDIEIVSTAVTRRCRQTAARRAGFRQTDVRYVDPRALVVS
jgi:hypothetical protein